MRYNTPLTNDEIRARISRRLEAKAQFQASILDEINFYSNAKIQVSPRTRGLLRYYDESIEKGLQALLKLYPISESLEANQYLVAAEPFSIVEIPGLIDLTVTVRSVSYYRVTITPVMTAREAQIVAMVS